MGEPAAGQHQQERRRDADTGQFARQGGEITRGDRFDIGAGDCRGGTFVLADFAHHLM